MIRTFNGFYMKLLLFIFCIFSHLEMCAAITQVNGKWVKVKYAPSLSAPDHYDKGFRLFNENNWEDALTQFTIINLHFQETAFYPDALFYSGVCYYFKGEFDLANKQFDQYLLLSGKLKHFEKVFEFKYHIAEAFRSGRKKHPFGIAAIPKVAPAKSNALALYEEINVALPASELAASALMGKGELLRSRRAYKESIEAFQTLTKRFPKHSLAAESFIKLSEVYVEQSREEPQNPDYLSLALLNIQRFQKSFPSEERIALAEANFKLMQEIYAESLYETGRFYEKKRKRGASAIYYRDTLTQYPRTEAAQKSQERLITLKGEG